MDPTPHQPRAEAPDGAAPREPRSDASGAAGGVDAAELRRLRWRARRGMLENDLVVTRFLDRHETELGPDELRALQTLLALEDNDLFDLLIGRAEPRDLDAGAVRLLNMMRGI